MTRIEVSRRNLLATGACALVGAMSLPGAARASAWGGENSANEEIIRKWYAAWENKDLGTFDALLADNFTFTSAAGDDHISKTTFKKQCWDTQIGFIDKFEMESVLDDANEAFVMYTCRTKNGKAFRNVEHFRFRGDQIAALECYFGEQNSFPSAESARPT